MNLLSLLLVKLCIAFASGGTWTKVWAVPAKGNQVLADNLGNPFVINGDQLLKFKDSGMLFRQYSNKALGRISFVDTRNPLKILLFYKDFSKIVFLDNTVTENGSPIFLGDYQLEQASLACSSYDNGFWVYDQVQYNLVRFDQRLQISTQATSINQVIGKKLQPVYMIEQENHLYISDPAEGILQFDIFGTYIKTWPFKGINKFHVENQTLIYLDSTGELVFFNFKLLRETRLRIPVQEPDDLVFERDVAFIIRKDTLYKYALLNQ